MTDNGICSLLGLAKRAGKLAAGDEPVRELAKTGTIRVVFLAADAGESAVRQAAFFAKRAKVPLLRLPVASEALGGALGRKTCALCALSDSGFAAKAAEKLAAIDDAFRPDADTLRKQHERFQSRRGVKKYRAAKPDSPAGTVRHRTGAPRSRRPSGRKPPRATHQ